ncbi:tripartite tricarboxylate transporter TctB family protein [Billgrantia endophytica]|uniref:Tripartite tricarboxylate transporter TctB family protein n=1 Tax=Billgrantia endophytica TaxID=2033802 RepID=A0A2N7UEF2_9GAMM|nr:tripartite tricarboxylate transporter TctB family protein [Halomonas endophytica]PMR78765.1 tripartite tricarboxylate transporter TctB family protein [Halomonas endophytica]
MYNRDYRDLIGGGLMALLGTAVVIYGLMTMSVGTLQRMGPGFFPISAGFILAASGSGIFIPALFRPGTLDAIEWRPLITITASLILFGLILPKFGLVPAIMMLVATATLGQHKISPISIIITSLFLSLMSYLIFYLGLGLTLTMARWPY